MNRIKKYTICLCMMIIAALFMNLAVFAEYYEFKIDGPSECGVQDTVEVTVTLSSDDELEDSDAFLVYDTAYFEYVDSECDEHDDSNGTVRLRGSFDSDSSSCSWTVKLLAKKTGSAEFEITDKWVKNGNGQVVSSTADSFTIKIGESGSAASAQGNDDDTAEMLILDSSYTFHFTEPDTVPSCFDETTAVISGVSCKAWKFNSKMSQKAEYGSDIEEFYAVYGYIDNESDSCWYTYDTKTESLSRLLMLQDVEIEKTPEPVNEDKDSSSKEAPSIFNNITQLMIIAIVALIVLIIVVNVIFNKMEAKSRKKRIQERQRLSREELRQKREIENKIQKKKEQEAQSQNMRRPD